MTIETLEKRIEGKNRAIDKLSKKMERILKAKESDYKENNPYYYDESDFRRTERELKIERTALADYKDQLLKEIEKAGSRNVKVLVDFLENWKVKTIAWFLEERVRYDEARKEYFKKNSELTEKFNSSHDKEERESALKANRKLTKEFREAWTHITQFDHGSLSWEETMKKDIEIEKNRKYDDIIERTNKITGKITDASNLKIDAKSNINGFIIGERGKAKVETIGAGGYNIQCYHFRTLVHEIKEER